MCFNFPMMPLSHIGLSLTGHAYSGAAIHTVHDLLRLHSIKIVFGVFRDLDVWIFSPIPFTSLKSPSPNTPSLQKSSTFQCCPQSPQHIQHTIQPIQHIPHIPHMFSNIYMS